MGQPREVIGNEHDVDAAAKADATPATQATAIERNAKRLRIGTLA